MRYLFPAVVLLLAATASAAPTDSPEAPARGACREEAKKICGDIKPGAGALRQCMETNRDKFSPACQERRSQPRQGGQSFKACQEDAKKMCVGVSPGEGRIRACLQKNEAQLSEDCRAMLKHKPLPRPSKDAT